MSQRATSTSRPNSPRAPSSPNSPSRTYGGESAEQRAHTRRLRLLDAALTIIGEEGLGAATVRAVCARAGLTQRYYYQTFVDADDMLTQVYNAQLERLESVILAAVQETTTPETTIRAGLTTLFTLVRDEPRLGRVIFLEVLGVSPAVDETYRAGTQRFVTLVQQLLMPMLAPAGAADLNDQLLSTAAVGAIVQVAMTWMLAGFDLEITEIVDNLSVVLSAIATTDHANPV